MKISKLNFILRILFLSLLFIPQSNAAATNPLDKEISWENFIQDLEELRKAFIDDFDSFNILFSPTWTTISWNDINQKFPKITEWLPTVNEKISKNQDYISYFDALIPIFTNVRSSCYNIISNEYRNKLTTEQQEYAQTTNLVDNYFMGKWGAIQFELTFINLAFSIIYDLITEQIFTDLILNGKNYNESYLQDTKIKPSKTFQEINKLTPVQLTQFCEIFGIIYKFLVTLLIDNYSKETPISKATNDFFTDPDNKEKWKNFIQEHINLFVGKTDASGTLQAGEMVMNGFKPIYVERINKLLNLASEQIKDDKKIKAHLGFGEKIPMETISNDLSGNLLSDYLTVKWMNTPVQNEKINYQNEEDYFSKNFSMKLKDIFKTKINAYKENKEQGIYAESEKINAIKFFYDLEFQKMLFRIHHPKIGCFPDILIKQKVGGTTHSIKKEQPTKKSGVLQLKLIQLRNNLTELKNKMQLLQAKLETLKDRL